MPGDLLSTHVAHVLRSFDALIGNAIKRIVLLEGPADPQRPFDEVRAAVAGRGLLDGCVQWTQILEELLEGSANELTSTGEGRCLGPNIRHHGGQIQFNAAELLAELVAVRTGLPSTDKGPAAQSSVSLVPQRTCFLQLPDADTRLRRIARQITWTSDDPIVEKLAAELRDVYSSIETSVAALEALCGFAPHGDGNSTAERSTEPILPRAVIDRAILSLSGLIAVLSQFAACWDAMAQYPAAE